MAASAAVTQVARALDALHGTGASAKVAEARVLVVGAGGVGCELLKNLALNGFRSITVIDLDTIDVSNLNRQFLFRRAHVGKSKAETAAASIRAMAPEVQIEGIVANIKDARFNIQYFKLFTLVCNALDNLEARRHVNRICLAAEKPLIESGSTGYNGQVSVHGPGYECYDCIEKFPQKTIAVCTIRSTPEKPVHCVVWAKALWDLIFAPDDEGNVLSDMNEEAYQPGEVDIVEGDVTPKAKKPTKRVRYIQSESADSFAERVCRRVFEDDIASQAAMKDLWSERQPPTEYDVPSVVQGAEAVDLDSVQLLEHRMWEREECARVLYAALKRMVEQRHEEIGSVPFDKDDREALAFVVAAANLRCFAYNVPRSSPFNVKGIAGNIIQAIATTNAVVGGLVAQEALRIVVNDGKLEDSKNAFFMKTPNTGRLPILVNAVPLSKPNPDCYVCSKGQLQLTIDAKRTTLKMLVDHVISKRLSVSEPSIYVTAANNYNNIAYESGKGLEEDEIEMYNENLTKKLSELRIDTGSQLTIEDMKQNLKLDIHVMHEDYVEEDKPVSERFKLVGVQPKVKEDEATQKPKTNVVDDVDEISINKVIFVTKKDERGGGEGATNKVEAVENNNDERKVMDMGDTNGSGEAVEAEAEAEVIKETNGTVLKRKPSSIEADTRPLKKAKDA